MKLVVANNTEFSFDDARYTVSSIEVADGHVVSLIGNGIEVTALAATRGEGMLQLSDFLKKLSYKLSTEAFVREGAIELNKENTR